MLLNAYHMLQTLCRELLEIAPRVITCHNAGYPSTLVKTVMCSADSSGRRLAVVWKFPSWLGLTPHWSWSPIYGGQQTGKGSAATTGSQMPLVPPAKVLAVQAFQGEHAHFLMLVLSPRNIVEGNRMRNWHFPPSSAASLNIHHQEPFLRYFLSCCCQTWFLFRNQVPLYWEQTKLYLRN